MQTKNSALQLVSESPHRAHARAALSMAHEDVTRGVLLERLAEFLCQQVRGLHGKPKVTLLQVLPGEASEFRQWAANVMRLADEIEAERPPTAFEIARYEQRKALVMAHHRVRCQAVANGHLLGVWRADIDRVGFELASCEHCSAGASVRLDSAIESISDSLLASCPGARPGLARRGWIGSGEAR